MDDTFESVDSMSPPVEEAPAVPEDSSVVSSGESGNITVNVVMPGVEAGSEAPAETAPPVEEDPASDGEAVEEEPAVVWTTTKTIDTSVTASDSSLSAMVQAVFGEYVPRTQTVTETGSDGSSVTYTECVPGLAGLDWYWLSGVALFSLVLLSFFKLAGVLMKR